MGLRAINKAMPRTKTQADLDYDYLSSGGSYYEINGKLYREDTDDEITFGYDTGKVNAADEFRRQAFQRTPPEKLKETFGFDDQDIINFSKQQKAEELERRKSRDAELYKALTTQGMDAVSKLQQQYAAEDAEISNNNPFKFLDSPLISKGSGNIAGALELRKQALKNQGQDVSAFEAEQQAFNKPSPYQSDFTREMANQSFLAETSKYTPESVKTLQDQKKSITDKIAQLQRTKGTNQLARTNIQNETRQLQSQLLELDSQISEQQKYVGKTPEQKLQIRNQGIQVASDAQKSGVTNQVDSQLSQIDSQIRQLEARKSEDMMRPMSRGRSTNPQLDSQLQMLRSQQQALQTQRTSLLANYKAPTPQPAAQPVAQPAPKPAPQPTLQPAPQPTAQPMAKTATQQPAQQPVAQPVPQPLTKSVSQILKPAPTVAPAPKPEFNNLRATLATPQQNMQQQSEDEKKKRLGSSPLM